LFDVGFEETPDKDIEIADLECLSECCAPQRSKPYHPIIDFSSTKRIQGKQSRLFKVTWFKEHYWLSFCISRNRVFCFYCRIAITKGLLTFSKNVSNTFVTKGFNNWKKAKENFREHEQCHAYSEACMKVNAIQQPSVAACLSSKTCRDQENHRQVLIKQLSSLQYLARQGLALRGHNDDDGNLSQLLKCRAKEIAGMGEWLRCGTYQSHDIVNEIIQLMANQLLRHLLHDIRTAEWYSVIADKTRDI